MKTCYYCFNNYEDEFTVCPHCGQIENTSPAAPIYLKPGMILSDRYIIGQSAGAGGFGIVYRAWDTKLETVVAVKEFFATKLVTRAGGLKDVIVSQKSKEEFEYRKQRFLAEAKTMAKFGMHRSIPNVYEYFEENGTAYIVMELLRGQSLSDYMNDCGGAIDTEFAVMITTEVAKALRSLHNEGIIHRDVAPDNIFICTGKDIRIKLMDLGAAKLPDVEEDVLDIILKPGYSPSEQYDNENKIGPYSDIYALGASLYVMLTGIKPDESTNRKIQDIVVEPHEINPDIPENLSNIVMKAMAVDSHMRFKNCDDLIKALNGDKKVVSIAKERKRRNARRWICATILVAVAVVSGIISYRTFSKKKAEEGLNPATFEVWFAYSEGSGEVEAMESIKSDFEAKFDGVKLELRPILEEEYVATIREASEKGNLPTLFESTDLSDDLIKDAKELKKVISSNQFKDALFLEDYSNYYSDNKRMPLAIEVPIAYVITNGNEDISYDKTYFKKLEDFNYNNIVLDSNYLELINKNYKSNGANTERNQFLDNEENHSAVMISSSMAINEVRETLVNYQKIYVYPDGDSINCNYTYEWSIGTGSGDEVAAAERLLSWMLGNVYQNSLMVSRYNGGQIPVSSKCFETKIESQYYAPIKNIYKKFKFERD